MSDIRKIVKKLIFNEAKFMLKESFFRRSDSALENVIQSFKNLFLNLRYSIDQPHKLNFFSNHIKGDLQSYKNYLLLRYNKKTKKEFIKNFKSLLEDIDYDLIKKLGLPKFLKELMDILKNEPSTDEAKIKIENIFNQYCASLNESVFELLKEFEEKISENEFYEPLKNINTVSSNVSFQDFLKEKYLLQIELLKLQEWIKDNNEKVLIILDGRDASGKGSTIKIFTENLNPKNYRVEEFGVPTKQERKNWFKRYKEKLPEKGEMVFFDRSWYNRGYLEPVMGYCNKKEYNDFMNKVNNFEENLIKSGVKIIKIWLSVSKDIQKLRFEARKSNPLKYWKYSTNDEETMDKWDSFTEYINKMFKHTHKKKCPWIIIDSNDYRSSKLNAMKKILSKFNYDEKDSSVLNESQIYNKEKIIFLDIDGVLIDFKSPQSVNHKEFNENNKWDKKAIEDINNLIEKTGAKIVISSSYRKNKTKEELQQKFNEIGLKAKIHGIISGDLDKSSAIKKYIKNENITNFIVIDDQVHSFKKDFPTEFINVQTNVGFDKENLERAIRILNNYKPKVIYSAVLIEDPSEITKIQTLVDQYVPKNSDWEKPHNYHMTISLGKFPESLYLRGDLNKEVTLTINSVGISKDAIALGTFGYYSKNDIPHITLAFQKNSQPSDSKEIKNWKPINNILIKGMIREIGENNQIIK